MFYHSSSNVTKKALSFPSPECTGYACQHYAYYADRGHRCLRWKVRKVLSSDTTSSRLFPLNCLSPVCGGVINTACLRRTGDSSVEFIPSFHSPRVPKWSSGHQAYGARASIYPPSHLADPVVTSHPAVDDLLCPCISSNGYWLF